MNRRLALLLLLLLAGPLRAEIAYVTDELRLGVHELADTSDQAFAYLNSGDAVEILERQGRYARVRLENGREGWVRATFLVSEEPARRRLARVVAERDQLAEELAGYRDGNKSASARLAALEERARSAEEQLQSAAAELDALRASTAADRERLVQLRFNVPLRWALLAATVALFLGIVSAAWWIDHRSRKRHGGFRIY